MLNHLSIKKAFDSFGIPFVLAHNIADELFRLIQCMCHFFLLIYKITLPSFTLLCELPIFWIYLCLHIRNSFLICLQSNFVFFKLIFKLLDIVQYLILHRETFDFEVLSLVYHPFLKFFCLLTFKPTEFFENAILVLIHKNVSFINLTYPILDLHYEIICIWCNVTHHLSSWHGVPIITWGLRPEWFLDSSKTFLYLSGLDMLELIF